jgi:RimJ/RimL family protein N-acetyltransferase
MAIVPLVPQYPVETARLSLRPLTADHADDLLRYRGRADVCRFLPFEPMTREVLLSRLAGDMSRTDLTDEGQALVLGVRERGMSRVIGDVMLFWRSREQGGGELGYVFAPDAQGRGFAAEACAVLLALAFEDLGLHRVIARLDARNDASARLATRLGMRREAHLVRNEFFKGEWTDEWDFAVLDEEWPSSPAARLHRGS